MIFQYTREISSYFIFYSKIFLLLHVIKIFNNMSQTIFLNLSSGILYWNWISFSISERVTHRWVPHFTWVFSIYIFSDILMQMWRNLEWLSGRDTFRCRRSKIETGTLGFITLDVFFQFSITDLWTSFKSSTHTVNGKRW